MESDALESRAVRRSSLGFRRVFQGEEQQTQRPGVVGEILVVVRVVT